MLNYKFSGGKHAVRAFASLLHEKLTARDMPGMTWCWPCRCTGPSLRKGDITSRLRPAGIMNKPEVSAV